ncbi:MAG TPA: ATP-binding cassette domain-containing protein, partial [Myxococcaceae bacterium]|nr:ATP-binding cassette domain-containing protein [Myxococcaceae bacterium]
MSVIVEQVTKRFTATGTPAVSDVSFHAPSGAITTLLGPSGAGKSTLLRLIAGLELPDSGSVRIEGVDCTHLPVQQRGIGVVFQSYALFKHMTVRQNIAFGLETRRQPRADIEARVDEMLHLIQLEDLGKRYPSQLSGGQRQRVAFARALAIRPKLLLLDEPFGALDSRVRVELREWLQSLHERTGVTTLLVTHDQEEALEISQHVVVMSDGRVAQAGRPEDIYDRPST